MQERLIIYDEIKKDKSRPQRKLINTGTVFHRFALQKLSTDEGGNPEKGLIEGKSICPCRNKKNCTRTPT